MKEKKVLAKENTKTKNNKQEKKQSKTIKELTIENVKIIVCALFIIYACFACYKAYNTHSKENNNNNSNKEAITAAIDKETYEEIISYIPYYTFTTGIYKDAYNGTLIKESDIEDTLIAKSIFGRYEESYTSKNGNTEDIIKLLKNNNLSEKEVVYYKSDINNFLTKRYNVDLSMLKKLSTNITNLNQKYLTVDIKSTFLPERNKITINYVAYKENDDIILYEKALFISTNTNDNKYNVYANSNINSTTPLKTYNLKDENGNMVDTNELITKDFADYKNLFKHTFKKNATGYYWYSTELES